MGTNGFALWIYSGNYLQVGLAEEQKPTMWCSQSWLRRQNRPAVICSHCTEPRMWNAVTRLRELFSSEICKSLECIWGAALAWALCFYYPSSWPEKILMNLLRFWFSQERIKLLWGNPKLAQHSCLVSGLVVLDVSGVSRLLCWPSAVKEFGQVHRKQTRWCTYRFLPYSCISLYYLTVLSWICLQNGVMLPGKCWKSYARHDCASSLSGTNVSQKTEVPMVALKSKLLTSCVLTWVVVENLYVRTQV